MSGQESIVITAAARTPIGRMQGALSTISVAKLGAVAIQATLDRARINSETIDEVYFGNVVSAGVKQAPARQAALIAGLSTTVPCTTISKVCGSGMKSVMIGRDQIAAGNADVVICGGMENMSATPYLIPKARNGLRLGHGELSDSLLVDGLEDAGTGELMGHYAQLTADQFNIDRATMDAFAIRSLQLAQHAAANGVVKEEIATVSVETRKGIVLVDRDELPYSASIKKVGQLKPAFSPHGSITAANASSMSDGAAALLLMRECAARAQGLSPLVRIVAQASHAQAPTDFCMAPIGAIEKVVEKANWHIDDVDLFEINEAFALVPLLAIEKLGLNIDCVNIGGGACSLGHPLGASGARIMVTLAYAMKRLGKSRGVACLCIGGGEATAVALELPQKNHGRRAQ